MITSKSLSISSSLTRIKSTDTTDRIVAFNRLVQPELVNDYVDDTYMLQLYVATPVYRG